MRYLFFLYRNLARKKLRTILTLFSIVTAFTIFGTLGSFNAVLNAGVELAGADRLVSVNKISFIQPMPYAYYQKVSAVEGVRRVTHANWFGGYFQDPRQVIPVFAVDGESYLDVYPEIVLDPEQKKVWLADRRGVIVGKKLADLYGWKPGDAVPLKSNIFKKAGGGAGWDFRLDGIFTGADPGFDTRFALFHYAYFNESLGSGRNNYIGWLITSVDDPAHSDVVAQRIDAMFANSPFETKTSSEEAFNKAFIAQIGDIGLIITAVVGAAFFTILLVAANTMALAIRERTREIAVMKTLGFPSPLMFRLVIMESLTMTLVGGALGLGLSWLAIAALTSALGGLLPNLSMPPEIVAGALGLMVALGLLAGILPAWQALRLNVVTALQRN